MSVLELVIVGGLCVNVGFTCCVQMKASFFFCVNVFPVLINEMENLHPAFIFSK